MSRSVFIALALLPMMLSPLSCSSKKPSASDSAAEKGSTKTVKNQGADPKDKTSKSDSGDGKDESCDTASLVADATDTEPCTSDDDDEGMEPDAAFYEGALNPPELTACHDQGKMFDRESQACLTAGYPATFKCDHAGVLAAFGNDPTVATELNSRDAGKWIYDQCGVLNNKPYVLLACFVTDDQDCNAAPTCKSKDQLDAAAIKICTGKIAYE